MYNRYSSVKKFSTEDGVRYYTNPIYPDIEETEDDFYILSTIGDRYDILAKRYYNDSSYWWIIASANNSNKDNLTITPGQQIRIPADKEGILSKFEDLNKVR